MTTEVSGDDSQPCSSNKAVTDHNPSFCVELPEDDPLFEKKQKLLQQKGFASKERVYVECSSHDWISITLRALLQRARIIHLNEVELYFGEMHKGQFDYFFGPRNELESLNYVLSLIDITRKEYGMKVFLQDLKRATIQKLVEFGEQNQMKITFLEKSCVKEKQLLQWAETNGIKSKLQIVYVEGAGRGAAAVEDLEVGETALEIPSSVIISEDLVYKSDMFPILEKIEDISPETMLLLWSMRERHDSGSKYKIYFDTLPENFNTGLNFGMEAIMALDGTLVLQEILQAKEHLRSQYDEMFPELCDRHPDVFPPQCYSWEQYLWACELWYSNSMKVMFTDGRLRTCLIPVAGLLNHSVCPHVLHYGKMDPETCTLKFPLSRPCKTGEQCYLSYGNLSSSHLLTFYGFFPQEDNPYDFIPLGEWFLSHAITCLGRPWICTVTKGLHQGFMLFCSSPDTHSCVSFLYLQLKNVPCNVVYLLLYYKYVVPAANNNYVLLCTLEIGSNETCSESEYPESGMTTHMVRGTCLAKNHDIFFYGLPTPLLDHLRKAQNPFLDPMTSGNLENELHVLELLRSIFEDMMSGLGEEELDDRENTSWDVKLAVEFKDLQRKIVASILKSCHTGR